jgi:phosphoribosylpyrophosphate synthetase
VIVARNPGSAKKATSYAERLRLGIAVIHGEQRESESDMNDGRYSPPTLSSLRTMQVGVGVPVHPAKEKPPINVVGDVGGRIAIMVDDMVDDVQSFVAAAEVLKERGAYKIYVLATHGLLSSDAPRLIEESPIDEVGNMLYLLALITHAISRRYCLPLLLNRFSISSQENNRAPSS